VYTPLGTAPLTGGEILHCGVVQTPDQEWGPRLIPFLAHKQPKWRSHIAASFERELDQLETRFYVGTLNDPNGPLVTTVMVAGAQRPAGRVGLLGYVFTAPEHRGKGAYSALMSHQMKHCLEAAFTILTLTTQRDSTAWRIYERFGFCADHPTTTGRMHWLARPNALQDWFAPSGVTTHPLAWEDWTALNVTAVQVPTTDQELPRSWALYLPTHGTAEGTFSDVLPAWAQLIGTRPRERASHAVTFRAQSGAVAGWLFVIPDPLSLGTAKQVDFYLHPAFETTAAAELVRELESLGTDLTAYVTRPDGYRARALARAGFRHSGTLPDWLSQEGARLDVHAFRKSQ
jgi:GNAT superfamily N-acetyltransferase